MVGILVSFWGPAYFQGLLLLVSRSVLRFFLGIIGIGPTRWWFQLFSIFTPTYLGKMNPILTSIFFQMGGEKPPTRKMMNMSLKGRFVFLDLPSFRGAFHGWCLGCLYKNTIPSKGGQASAWSPQVASSTSSSTTGAALATIATALGSARAAVDVGNPNETRHRKRSSLSKFTVHNMRYLKCLEQVAFGFLLFVFNGDCPFICEVGRGGDDDGLLLSFAITTSSPFEVGIFFLKTFSNHQIPFLKLTWHLKMDGWRWISFCGPAYVSFRECKQIQDYSETSMYPLVN